MLLLTPLLMRMTRSIEQPLKALADFSRDVGREDMGPACTAGPPRGSPEEVRQLHRSFCRMNSRVQETIATLEKSAVTDQLTGAPNRRLLMREGARIMDQSRRAGRPCACFMLDLDHFKRVNDTWGHQAGDRVLVGVARILEQTLRASDLAARYGGEEFAVVAPNADADQALALAERIRQAVAAEVFTAEAQTFGITVSIGVAEAAWEVERGASLLEDCLARADEALYLAKQSGRNRVEVWGAAQGMALDLP
jgi:diguanylate cyclase (GGDEF)-like protein